MKDDVRNPYQLFFPLGLFIGAAGVSLWIMLEARWIGFYPREAHGNLMYFGMLWPFVVGFLMTAIPRMTGTFGPSYLELALAALLIFGQLVLNLRNLISPSVFLFGAQAFFLLTFIVRRFLLSRRIPFPGFIFLPSAFLQAGLGVALFSLSIASRETVLLLAGEAFLMNLILGLGSRLIPMISRIAAARSPRETQPGEDWIVPVLTALILNLGYFLEIFGYVVPGRILRWFAIAGAGFLLLGLHRRPQVWTFSGIGFKAGVVFLLVGQALVIFGGGLPAQHLIYIGGFGLITLLVSTRVVLAHGGADLSYEVGSRRLAAMIACLILAAVSRWWAGPIFNSGYTLLAAGVFISALVLWGFRFFTIRHPEGSVE